jgi:hypothetical protein
MMPRKASRPTVTISSTRVKPFAAPTRGCIRLIAHIAIHEAFIGNGTPIREKHPSRHRSTSCRRHPDGLRSCLKTGLHRHPGEPRIVVRGRRRGPEPRERPGFGSVWLLLRVTSGWNQGGVPTLLIGQAAYPALRRGDADSPGNPAAISFKDLGQKLCVPPFRMVCPVTNELE